MENLYGNVVLLDSGQTVGTGWLPPRPDLRDYTMEQQDVKSLSKKLGIGASKKSPPLSIDLREYCSAVENQGSIGSCTAHAGIGMVEYFERRAYKKHIEGSRLFQYKATRNLMQVTGDAGGWLRCAMGALVLCGVPAEKYWPYDISKYDVDPGSFIYSVAHNYQAVKYFCHDPIGARISYPTVLDSVKKYLEAGIPSMFGFWGFPSFDKSDTKGGIPYPVEGESAQWGHAVVAVGYDDNKKIINTLSSKPTTGALLIRNSWGKEWGENGYGWLPYEYVLNNLALDFWSLISMDWVDSRQFGI